MPKAFIVDRLSAFDWVHRPKLCPSHNKPEPVKSRYSKHGRLGEAKKLRTLNQTRRANRGNQSRYSYENVLDCPLQGPPQDGIIGDEGPAVRSGLVLARLSAGSLR